MKTAALREWLGLSFVSLSLMASSRAKPFFRRSQRSRVGCKVGAREIPVRRARLAHLLRAGSRPAGENAGLGDDATE